MQQKLRKYLIKSQANINCFNLCIFLVYLLFNPFYLYKIVKIIADFIKIIFIMLFIKDLLLLELYLELLLYLVL
jgi:hypothetical protein